MISIDFNMLERIPAQLRQFEAGLVVIHVLELGQANMGNRIYYNVISDKDIIPV